jgi:hypothetical protein
MKLKNPFSKKDGKISISNPFSKKDGKISISNPFDKKKDKESDAEKLKKLYKDLVDSRNKEEDASDQLTEAEQNYYNFKNGENGYDQYKDVQDKIKSLSIQKNSKLTMSPAEYRNIELQALYDEIIKSRANYEKAPDLVEEATKKYYIFKNGPDGYADYQLIKYNKDATAIKQTMLTKHQKQMFDMNESIHYSESQQIYLKNLSEVTAALAKKIKELVGEVRKDSINTNNRKTYYTELAEQSLSNWTAIVNCILVAFVLSLGYEYKNVMNHPIIWGTLLSILVFTFSLRYIISLLSKVPTSLSIYTEWGHDPNEPTLYWLIFIPISFILIYTVIRFFNGP